MQVAGTTGKKKKDQQHRDPEDDRRVYKKEHATDIITKISYSMCCKNTPSRSYLLEN